MCMRISLSVAWLPFIFVAGLGAALTSLGVSSYVHIMRFDASIPRAALYNERLCLSRLWIYNYMTNYEILGRGSN